MNIQKAIYWTYTAKGNVAFSFFKSPSGLLNAQRAECWTVGALGELERSSSSSEGKLSLFACTSPPPPPRCKNRLFCRILGKVSQLCYHPRWRDRWRFCFRFSLLSFFLILKESWNSGWSNITNEPLLFSPVHNWCQWIFVFEEQGSTYPVTF